MYRLLDKRFSDEEVSQLLRFAISLKSINLGFKCDLLLTFHCQRPCFGFAHRVHIYADCSILVCDYEAHGTLQVGALPLAHGTLKCDFIVLIQLSTLFSCMLFLQDVINSYLVIGQLMDEVLCIYYSIEMLRMLESLHNVGIIHGDFKPDNLLVRYAR